MGGFDDEVISAVTTGNKVSTAEVRSGRLRADQSG